MTIYETMLENSLDFDSLMPTSSEEHPVKTEPVLVDENFNDEESGWLWNGEPIETIDTKKFKCFVYLITNKITKKRYIGFKTSVSRKTRVVKGKKKRSEVESDWKSYWSSSDNLKTDVSIYGKGNFIREIIHFCPMKGVGKYMELQEQIERKVLTVNADKYYNGIVNIRLGANALKKYVDVVSCNRLIGDEIQG